MPRRTPFTAGVGAWAELIDRLASGSGRPAETAAAGVAAVLDLLPAEGAALLRWRDGQLEVVAAAGAPVPAFSSRPAEGVHRHGGSVVATVSLDPRTDLVAVRSDGGDFASTDAAALRALAAVLRWAGAGDEAQQRLLHSFASRVVASLDPTDVLTASADAAAALMRAEIAGVLLPDAAGEAVEMAASVGNTRMATARLRMRRGEGLAGRAFETGRPQRVDDYGTDPRSAPGLLALSDVEGTCSALAVPMRHEDRLQGVLCVWRRRREAFTDTDEALFCALADLCGAAVHNATAHEALRAEAEAGLLERARLATEAGRTAATIQLQLALNKVAREGGDVLSVLRTVGSALGCSAALVDSDGRVLNWNALAAPHELGRHLRAWLDSPQPAPGPDEVSIVQVTGGTLVVAPVRAVGLTLAHLALGFSSPAEAAHTLAAQQAALTAAVLLSREEAAVTAARRAQSEFVWDLLAGRLADDVEAALRAQHLGSGFSLPARVVAVSTPGATLRATESGLTADQVERARASVARLIAAAIRGAGCATAVLASRADVFAALVPVAGRDDDAERAGLATALGAISWPGGNRAVVGIGGRVDHVARFPLGWREAQLALSAAEPGVPAAFDNLGVLQFLLAPTSRADLDSFARRRVGQLLAYDAEHGTDLVATLDAYLKAECNTRLAAEAMFVHHRTLAYRLNRIEEVAGVRLRSPEDLLELQLALKILGLGPSDTPEPGAEGI